MSSMPVQTCGTIYQKIQSQSIPLTIRMQPFDFRGGVGEQKLPPGSKQFLSSNHTETNLFSFLPSRYSYLENSKSKHVPRKVPHRKQRVTLSVQDPEIAITELSGIIHQISSKSVKIIM